MRRLTVTRSFLSGSFRSRAALQIEILALHHQLTVLERSVKRPRWNSTDRWRWTPLSQASSEWRSALLIEKLETVIDWYLNYAQDLLHGRPDCLS